MLVGVQIPTHGRPPCCAKDLAGGRYRWNVMGNIHVNLQFPVANQQNNTRNNNKRPGANLR